MRDSWTFCEILGKYEGNIKMKRHWNTFYTEEDIKYLSLRGVKRISLPIGDWTIKPYGPYVGCMDGSEQQT